MEYYHVRLTRKSDPYHDLTRNDLSEQELRDRFLRPYAEARSIVIGGATVPPDDLQKISISRTPHPAASYIPRLRAEDATSGVIFVGGPSDEWRVADLGIDITDELIAEPPGHALRNSEPLRASPAPIVDPRSVFVVHGRNAKARDALFAFLRAIGLRPLEWTEAIRATGRASPYVGEILEAAFGAAQAVVILMTPDDEARLRPEFQEPGDPPHETELTPQARPNVLFEAGMAMGRDPDRTVLVELGRLRPFSDVGGRHAVRIDNSSQRRQDLAQRLETAGCPVNLTGTDWHSTGDFTLGETA